MMVFRCSNWAAENLPNKKKINPNFDNRNFLIMRNLFVFLFLLCITYGHATNEAQPDSNLLQTYYKIEDGQLLLRWNPANPYLWLEGRKNGYLVEKYKYPANGGKPVLVSKSTEGIIPRPSSDWLSETATEARRNAHILFHYDQMHPDSIEQDLPIAEYGESGRLNIFHKLSNYVMHADFGAVELAGLGVRDAELEPNAKYLYVVKLASNPDKVSASVKVDLGSYQVPITPTLQAEFLSSRVKLQWRTYEFRDFYYGYFLERSEDGVTFESINETPFVNVYDTTTQEALKSFYYTDSLAQNEKTYWYRLRGADYLGGISEKYTEVSGMGYEEIPHSPMIREAIQTDSNYAIIKWKFPEAFENRIKEFQIFHSDSLDGIFSPVVEGIDRTEREVAVRMRYNTNAYRVVLVPHGGPKKASFPALVMAWDEEPPAMPIGFTGTIDSLGIVRLEWDSNTEEDLDGYKVYKSYFKDEEFSGITSKPIQVTNFVDTVDMVVGNEWVYYTIQAVDERNNRSDFTQILELKKKDMYPPVEPHIHKVDKSTGQIEIHWYNSSSPDVESHRLFRKILGEEESWTMIKEYGLEDNVESYVDTNVVRKKVYAYTLVAIDDDGLESEPAQAATAKVMDYGLRDAIEVTEVNLMEDQKQVEIKWNYPLNASEFWVYKGSDKERTSLMKVVSAEEMELIDQNLQKGRTYHYYLKAFFEDGSFSPFTEKIEVQLDD